MEQIPGKPAAGVIGLGIIGSRVAACLRRAGNQVWLWNRTVRPEPNFLSGPAEIAEAARHIQIFVSNGEALHSVLRAMLPALTPEHIILNHATVSPTDTLTAAGEDFTKLAKELSEEPGASESGGDLGFFPKDRMVPEFAEAAFAQKVGDISKPVKTQFGWHVIKVTDRKEAGTVPFDQVKEQVVSYLKSTNQREAVEAVLNKLKESAKIETFLPAAS